ncbi:MAG: N-acetylmuramoyl-L-alanine amidase [Ruminococcaceae bacterium]|nr:N-acetylmuramoyl-L-alanine amidase [Oscillospiraceae bacterium]
MTEKDIITAYAVLNNCYKANKPLIPKGIVVHSTGANNPNLKRYVDSPALVGVNNMGNHWNTPKPGGREVCVHAFIGRDINGDVRVANILPYTMQCWGCSSGTKGSLNSSYIQFEVCEDSLSDKRYFELAISAAVEYCAYLCHKFSLDTENILSHAEAHRLGYASNHGDIDHWLKKYGWNMDTFRNAVRDVYDNLYTDFAHEVCKKCGFSDETRRYLDAYPYSHELWKKLWAKMK